MVNIQIDCDILTHGQRELIAHRILQFCDDLVVQTSPKYNDWLVMNLDGQEYEVDDIGMIRMVSVGDWCATPFEARNSVVQGSITPWEQEAREFAAANKRVSAVKVVRGATGMSLRDSLDLVKSWKLGAEHGTA